MNQSEQGYGMPTSSVFESQMEDMKAEMREMRAAVTKLADGMSKLAVMEERHMTVSAEIARINARVATVEAKTASMELERAQFNGSLRGVSNTVRIMWAISGGAAGYLVIAVFKLLYPGAA